MVIPSQAPQAQMDMGGMSQSQDVTGMDMPTQTPDAGAPMDPSMGGDPTMGDPNMMGNEDNQNMFDNNFDAGVEADEDSDPKTYIQQLTGKLSQKFNQYNNDNGGDEGLAKYVGKMIVKQVAKALDDAGKKDLIQAINTSDTEETDEDMEMGNGAESENSYQDNMASDDTIQQEPMQECVFTKNELRKIFENINQTINDDNENLNRGDIKNKKNNRLCGKKI